MRKKNIYFFGRHKTWPNFSFKSLSFSILSQILFGREMANTGTCKELHLQKLVKFRLSGKYSF